MILRQPHLFHPEKILQMGISLVGILSLCSVPFLGALVFSELPTGVLSAKKKEEVAKPIQFTLGLLDKTPSLPHLDLQETISFSFDPPRPDGGESSQRLRVLLNKSGLCKQITLPCRLDLKYLKSGLAFSDIPTPFWLEVEANALAEIQAEAFVTSKAKGKIEAGSFAFAIDDVPILAPQDSIFKGLAEARWWGRDLFKEQYVGGAYFERLEVGPVGGGELVELRVGDWLSFKDNKWLKINSLEEGKEKPIARLQSVSQRGLVFEGWNSAEYVRFLVSPAPDSPIKLKGEEMLTSVRVRSERQISCMLEKQCLVLKAGDLVLKTKGRWKVLRRKEDRDAYLNTKLIGDLFVFEQIQLRQGQKVVQGRFFNPSRTQTATVEVMAQQVRKSLKGRPQ
jgi:hypothetical protein